MFLANIALFHVALVSRLAEKRAPKEVQKAKGSLEPGEQNAFFSEKSGLCFRGWQDVDGKSTAFYNDLNIQKKAADLRRGIEADGFRKAQMSFAVNMNQTEFAQHESSYDDILWGGPGCPMVFRASPRRSRFPWNVFTSQNGVTLNKRTIKTFVDWSHWTKG